MTSDAPARRTGERRLHAAAIGAEALSGLRQIAVPLIVVALVGSGGGGSVGGILFYGIAGLVVSVVFAAIGWETTRWWLREDEVRLRTGVLSEKVVAIPLERVQAVDTVRGPVQRLFGVVELHVQAAGGGKQGEIVLKAVTTAEAEELREAVRAAGDTPTAAVAAEAAAGPGLAHPEAPAARPARPDGPRAEWRLGRGRLVAAALTSGSFGVLVPVVAGLSQTFDDVFGADQAERLVPHSVAAVALIVVGVVAAAWLLSVLGTLVAFAGFTATRDGERLRIGRGFLERREASVPVARVHAVRVIESPLREPFGLATVRIESAGYAAEAATAQTLLPVVRRRDVPAVLAQLLPELAAPPDLPFTTVPPPRARRRFLLPPVATALVVAAGLAIAFPPYGLLALLLLVPAAAFGLAAFRASGAARTGDLVVLRSRGLTRQTATADARRLQEVRTRANPFQRRGHLATLAVAVSSKRRLSAEHLDAIDAATLHAALAAAATAPPQRER